MGSAAASLFYISIMALFLGIYATNCSVNLGGCVRCDVSGTQCMKCRHVMDETTRECRMACGAGQKEAWSSRADAVGRLCVEAGIWAGLGLSGQEAAVLVGCLVGVALSLAAVLGGVVYMRRRARARLLTHDDSSDSTLTVTPLNQQDRGEFLSWLGGLRRDAPTFLAMLNETRAQARGASSLQPYKPVLRDLLTLLLLLNTPEARVLAPPPDWRRLLAWAERVLRRYKRQSQLTNTAVGELVSFLPYNTMSTASTTTLQSRHKDWVADTADRNWSAATTAADKDWEVGGSGAPKNWHNDTHKDWAGWNNNVRRVSLLDSDDCRTDPSPVVAPHSLNKFSFSDAELAAAWDHAPNALPLWSVPSREVLHEEDYGPLGFRPQDEITTEL